MLNVLLKGPFGTGKTFLSRAMAYYYCVDGISVSDSLKKDIYKDYDEIESFIHSPRCEYIQLHSSIDYTDIVYGKSINAGSTCSLNNQSKRLKILCDNAINSNEKFAIIFDDIDRCNLYSVLGNLLYALSHRNESIEIGDGNFITIPNNVIVIFTANSFLTSNYYLTGLLRICNYYHELHSDYKVIDNYYKNTINSATLSCIKECYNTIHQFVFDHAKIADKEKLIPGHGMYIVNRSLPSKLFLNAFFRKIKYQVIPWLQNLKFHELISGDIEALRNALDIRFKAGKISINRIRVIEKLVSGTYASAPSFRLDETIDVFFNDVVSSTSQINNRKAIECIVDAVILNGIMPCDIIYDSILYNPLIIDIESISHNELSGHVFAQYKPASEKHYLYYTPKEGRRVTHSYYSTVNRNGSESCLYRVAYLNNTHEDFILLNGVRNHRFKSFESNGTFANPCTVNNAVETYILIQKILSTYLDTYKDYLSIFKDNSQNISNLYSLVELELSLIHSMDIVIRGYHGDTSKMRAYLNFLLCFRLLWSQVNSILKVDKTKFANLVNGTTELTVENYSDIYTISENNEMKISVTGVNNMIDLTDYQLIMDTIGVKQMIYQGPPGTSKTYEAKLFLLKQLNPSAPLLSQANITQAEITNELEKYKLTNDDYEKPDTSSKLKTGGWDLVQFHPSYGYEDFIRGIEVSTSTAGSPVYRTVNKILGRIAEFAKQAENYCSEDNVKPRFYLLIDEINRANLATVFGELIYGLEYRNSSVATPYEVDIRINTDITSTVRTRDIVLGNNLYIIGTMNTADKSIDAIDYAIRRRFIFIDSPADRNVVIRAYQNITSSTSEECIELMAFDAVQSLFDDDSVFNSEYSKNDVRLGHTFFLRKSVGTYKEEFIEHMVFQVIPILKEYLKDGILYIPEDEELKEYSTNDIEASSSNEERIKMLANNILFYTSKLGERINSTCTINNQYIGDFFDDLCTKLSL